MIYSDCTTYRDSGEWGYLVTDDKGRELSRYSTKKKFLGVAYAEALGVLDAIRFAPHGGQVGCDNQEVVNSIHNHLNGRRPKGGYGFRNLIAHINKRCKESNVKVCWVRRNGNVAGLKHEKWVKTQEMNLPKGTLPPNHPSKLSTTPLAPKVQEVYTDPMTNDYLPHLREWDRKRKLRRAIEEGVCWLLFAGFVLAFLIVLTN